MAFAAGILAQAQLPNSEGSALATGGLSISVHLYNTHSAAEVVQLFLQKSGGTSRLIRKITLDPGHAAHVRIGDLVSGDDLRWASTGATRVNGTVYGRTL